MSAGPTHCPSCPERELVSGGFRAKKGLKCVGSEYNQTRIGEVFMVGRDCFSASPCDDKYILPYVHIYIICIYIYIICIYIYMHAYIDIGLDMVGSGSRQIV